MKLYGSQLAVRIINNLFRLKSKSQSNVITLKPSFHFVVAILRPDIKLFVPDN